MADGFFGKGWFVVTVCYEAHVREEPYTAFVKIR
jgi:hypothetical protein